MHIWTYGHSLYSCSSAWLRWLTSMGMNQPLRGSFESVLKRVEAAFESSGGPYFFGSEFSIVDIQFAPFLERMAASLLYYKGFNMRNNPSFPRLEQWFKVHLKLLWLDAHVIQQRVDKLIIFSITLTGHGTAWELPQHQIWLLHPCPWPTSANRQLLLWSWGRFFCRWDWRYLWKLGVGSFSQPWRWTHCVYWPTKVRVLLFFISDILCLVVFHLPSKGNVIKSGTALWLVHLIPFHVGSYSPEEAKGKQPRSSSRITKP